MILAVLIIVIIILAAKFLIVSICELRVQHSFMERCRTVRLHGSSLMVGTLTWPARNAQQDILKTQLDTVPLYDLYFV